MSMVTPIAQSIPAFDATQDKIFKFVSEESGDRIISNRLVISDNISGVEVYNQKINSYRYEHLVKANTLKNGGYYNFYFRTYNVDDLESQKSNMIAFRCYKVPELTITNIPELGIVKTPNFTLNISYNQEQKELMDSAKVILTDQEDVTVFESEILRSSQIPPFEINYTLRGLEDDTTYKVYVIANTVNKTVVESEKYIFTTKYTNPMLSSLIEIENNCEDGYIQLKNNFLIVNAESNPVDIVNNPNYMYDGKVNLLEDGTYISWSEGFNIQDDFTLKYFIETPNLGLLSTLGFGNNRIELSFLKEKQYKSSYEQYCLELSCYNGLKHPYYVYSNYVNDLSKVMVWVRRVNNLFEVKLENLNKIDTIYWNTPTGLNWNEPTGIKWR